MRCLNMTIPPARIMCPNRSQLKSEIMDHKTSQFSLVNSDDLLLWGITDNKISHSVCAGNRSYSDCFNYLTDLACSYMGLVIMPIA